MQIKPHSQQHEFAQYWAFVCLCKISADLGETSACFEYADLIRDSYQFWPHMWESKEKWFEETLEYIEKGTKLLNLADKETLSEYLTHISSCVIEPYARITGNVLREKPTALLTPCR